MDVILTPPKDCVHHREAGQAGWGTPVGAQQETELVKVGHTSGYFLIANLTSAASVGYFRGRRLGIQGDGLHLALHG